MHTIRGVARFVAMVALVAVVVALSAPLSHAQPDRVATPDGDWSLYVDESGPVSRWPGFEDLLAQLEDEATELSGELRAWQSSSGEVILTMIVDGPDGSAGDFLAGFADGAADAELVDDGCGLRSRVNVSVVCGETEGLPTVIATWQSGDSAIVVNAVGLSSTAIDSMISSQAALTPPTQRTAASTNLPRLVGTLMAYAVMGLGVIWLIKKLVSKPGGSMMVSTAPSSPLGPPAWQPPAAPVPPGNPSPPPNPPASPPPPPNPSSPQTF